MILSGADVGKAQDEYRIYDYPKKIRDCCKHDAAAAKSRQSCLTLYDPIDGSPPSSRPWDSPGKNTGVGCHFLLQCMKVKSGSEVAQSCRKHDEDMLKR